MKMQQHVDQYQPQPRIQGANRHPNAPRVPLTRMHTEWLLWAERLVPVSEHVRPVGRTARQLVPALALRQKPTWLSIMVEPATCLQPSATHPPGKTDLGKKVLLCCSPFRSHSASSQTQTVLNMLPPTKFLKGFSEKSTPLLFVNPPGVPCLLAGG